MWKNLILAISNIYIYKTIQPLYNQSRYLDVFIFTNTAMASFLYHLVEQKHTLPGVISIKNWTLFLNIDRVMAWTCALYLFICYRSILLSHLFLVIFTCCLGGFSDVLGRLGYVNLFVISHTIWHILAYEICYVVVTSPLIYHLSEPTFFIEMLDILNDP